MLIARYSPKCRAPIYRRSPPGRDRSWQTIKFTWQSIFSIPGKSAPAVWPQNSPDGCLVGQKHARSTPRSCSAISLPENPGRTPKHRGRTVGQASRRDRSRRNRGEVRSPVPAAGCRSGRSPGSLFSSIFWKFRSSSLAYSAKFSWIGLGVREIFGDDRNFDQE